MPDEERQRPEEFSAADMLRSKLDGLSEEDRLALARAAGFDPDRKPLLGPEQEAALREHLKDQPAQTEITGKPFGPNESAGRKTQQVYDWDALRPDQQEAYRALGKRSEFYPREDLGLHAGPGDPRLKALNEGLPPGSVRAAALFNWPGPQEEDFDIAARSDWIRWGKGHSVVALLVSLAVAGVLAPIAILGMGHIYFWKALLVLSLFVLVPGAPTFTWIVFNHHNRAARITRNVATPIAAFACIVFAVWCVSSLIVRSGIETQATSERSYSPNPIGLQRGTNGQVNAPLMMHWPIYYDRLDDGRIRATIGIYNTTGLPLSYASYGKIVVGPPKFSDASRLKTLLPLRDRVNEIATNNTSDHQDLMPPPAGRSKAVPDGSFEVMGPSVTPRQWNQIGSGRLYVYLYAIIFLTFGPTDTNTSTRECAIKAGIFAIHCPKSFEGVQ